MPLVNEANSVQLLGTFLTVLGGVIVAIITTRKGKKEGDNPELAVASRNDMVKLHADVVELLADVGSILRKIDDYWQWQRDQHQLWKDRFDAMRDAVRDSRP